MSWINAWGNSCGQGKPKVIPLPPQFKSIITVVGMSDFGFIIYVSWNKNCSEASSATYSYICWTPLKIVEKFNKFNIAKTKNLLIFVWKVAPIRISTFAYITQSATLFWNALKPLKKQTIMFIVCYEICRVTPENGQH